MKKIIFRFGFLSLLALFLGGCAGVGDYEIELPNRYVIVSSSAHEISLNRKSIEGSLGEAIISPKISKIAYNDNFVLMEQQGLKRRSPENENDMYEIPDESKVFYWILNHKTDKYYGPFTQKEFVEKKKELYIPNNLELKDLSNFKHNHGI